MGSFANTSSRVELTFACIVRHLSFLVIVLFLERSRAAPYFFSCSFLSYHTNRSFTIPRRNICVHSADKTAVPSKTYRQSGDHRHLGYHTPTADRRLLSKVTVPNTSPSHPIGSVRPEKAAGPEWEAFSPSGPAGQFFRDPMGAEAPAPAPDPVTPPPCSDERQRDTFCHPPSAASAHPFRKGTPRYRATADRPPGIPRYS